MTSFLILTYFINTVTIQCPDEYICPISMEIMRDPVITCDGHSFDRASLEEWLKENVTNPLTGASLALKTITPNYALKRLIDNFCEAYVSVLPMCKFLMFVG